MKKAASKKNPKKVLAATLYTYTRPENAQWVRSEAKKLKIPYSRFLDYVITSVRASKIRIHAPSRGKEVKAA